MSAEKKTLCLNMIVKDEAHIIVQTLTHLTELLPLDYWVISDTGSTDGTQELIRKFFAEKQIPGELHEDPWKNFGHNRSLALKHAYNKTDYVIVWDADDYCVGKINFPAEMTADEYHVVFGTENGFRYIRKQIFNNHKRWKYVGVLHEFPACDEPIESSGTIRSDYFIVSGRSGNRNKDPKKYQKDAAMLEEGLLEEPNNTRYVFYCANSYNHAGMYDEAIVKYKKALAMNTWSEEKYVSCLELFDIYENHKKTPEKALHWLLESVKYSPQRVECISRLARYYYTLGNDSMAVSFYTIVADYYEHKYLQDDVSRFLFARKQEYDFFLPYYVMMSAVRMKNYDLAVRMFAMIFRTKYMYIGPTFIANVFTNLQSIVDYLPLTDPTFLDNLLGYKTEFYKKGFPFSPEINNSVSAIIEKYRTTLGETVQNSSGIVRPLLKKTVQYKQNPSTPVRVLFSITTCKRMDLFTKTMNSILRTWKDLSVVDYFLCVDDNSSEEDRKQMRAKYPFFNFVMKTETEKGHRQSMNIIWNKLQELRPTYWIHMEDDWLFFKAENYVQQSIDFLEKYDSRNIHQILFNRNYTETYDWDVMGGEKLEPGFLLHLKSNTIPGRSSGYWPHYSFRPSMVRVQKILELGNYDSPNTFFERDYADRYFAKGYKSAFFDTIVSLHIGKLTSDHSGTNAYTLNQESQFGKKNTKTSPNTFVVNLKRRPDRRREIEDLFKNAKITDYEFYEAVDGKSLTVTDDIVDLFQGNDFGNRCGVIGCALSHYRLWQRLVADPQNDYYVIFEDDITLCENFRERLEELVVYIKNKSLTMDVLFLGYHTRTPEEKLVSIIEGKHTVVDLDLSCYIGGTFGYIVTKQGAQNYLRYIGEKGIKHGIDYLAKIIPGFQCKNVQPQLVFSDWVQTLNSTVDSDIQKDGYALKLVKTEKKLETVTNREMECDDWVFFEGLDSYGEDMAYIGKQTTEEFIGKASQNTQCVAFNTMGYLKHAVKFPLEPSNYVRSPEGIYIKRSHIPEEYLTGGIIQPKQLKGDINVESICRAFPVPIKNRICIIHSCHLKESGTAVLDILMSVIKTYNLLNDVDHIVISNVGHPLPTEKYTSLSKKIHILQQSSDPVVFEIPTLKFIKQYSMAYPSTNVLYLHTKGIRCSPDSKHNIMDWILYMLAFLVEKKECCYKYLENADTVGCNYSEENQKYFSGNFWWARASYLKDLPDHILTDKSAAEFWVMHNNPSYQCIYDSKINHYLNPYPREIYEDVLRTL